MRTEHNRSPNQMRVDQPSKFAHIAAENCAGVINTRDIPAGTLYDDPNVAQHCKKLICPMSARKLALFKLCVDPIDATEIFNTYKDRYINARNVLRKLLL